MNIIFKSASLALISALGVSLANAELSQADFRNPPPQARPSALWSWLNGYVDNKQITHELEEMKAKGMRGALIWDVGSISDPTKMIPAGPAFLGNESLASIHHAMAEADRLGLEIGLFASSSWNAGGSWITPKDGSKALLWSELKVKGPQEFSAVLPLPDKISDRFTEVSLMAVPSSANQSVESPAIPVRLEKKLAADGCLTWSVPAGEWTILRFVCNNTGENLNCPSPNSNGLIIDHLSKEATEAHWNHILDTILGDRKDGGSMKTMMLDSYEVRPATDWTPDFIKKFAAANGYDPTPWLPVLAGWNVGNAEETKRFKHDYTKMVSDLLIEDHFVRSREMLNQRGIKLLAEGGHGGHSRVDPLKALGAADIPMGEFWNHRKNWVTKEAASAAHIYGKQFVNAETLTGWQNWQDGPAGYKRLFDIALCAGLNQATFHTFAHQPPSAGKPGFAYHAREHLNVNSTWWDEAGPMLADMSRSCQLLQQGKFVADVLAYYGDDAPNLVPARRIAPTIESQWSDDKCAHCGVAKPVDLSSLSHGYDYDYVNEEVIMKRMEFRDGKLVLPDGMSYRLLVLPDREAISPTVLRKIGELVKAGATVVGRKPERSNSLKGFPGCDDEVRGLANEIWGDCDGQKIHTHAYGKGKVMWNRPLDEVLGEMDIAPDFTVEEIENKDQHIDFTHRATEEEDIYLVSNSSLERQEITCRFRAESGRTPSFWHPQDGSVEPCNVFEVKDGFVRVPLALDPASSVFVVFRKDGRADHILPMDKSEIEVLALDDGKAKVRVSAAGAYRLKTAKGKAGSVAVNQVPEVSEISGAWKLEFPKGRGAPLSVTMDKLIDWTQSSDPGVKYFSGTATYRKTFEIVGSPKTLFLDLGKVGEVASVKINGKDAGILWKQPYRVDIVSFIKSGDNELEISVTNLWNNRIVGDLQSNKDEDFTSTNLKNKFTAKSPLLPSGLIGPVTLRTPVDVDVKLE